MKNNRMPDYSKGKIYTIRSYKDDRLIYVGSTIQPLSTRFGGHKCDKNMSLFKYVDNPENNTTWDDWYIELYEKYPCGCKEELCQREKEVIRAIATINKQGFYDTRAECRKGYRAKHSDELRAKRKEYYTMHLDKENAKRKEYYTKHLDKIKAREKEYYVKNADKIKARDKEYRTLKKISSFISLLEKL